MDIGQEFLAVARRRLVAVAMAAIGVGVPHGAALAEQSADLIYRNGFIYTSDAHRSIQQAVAVVAGRFTFVGNEAGAAKLIGPNTVVVDLHGRMLMPGLVDGHQHPLSGGHSLLGCDLHYARLTQEQFAGAIQKCLDETRSEEPNGWLEVHNWFQEAMIGGAVMTKGVLDQLNTQRPIFVLSSFGHTALANSRALAIAHIDAHSPQPRGGHIEHNAAGNPTGLLQDAAFAPVQAAIRPPTHAQDVVAAQAALTALNAQGVTTFLDAAADLRTISAFSDVQKGGQLSARAHFAVLIRPQEASDPARAVAAAHHLAQQFDQGALQATPAITVHNIKLFLDGVITAPAMTGSMIEPYRANVGTAASPRWVSGTNRGPAPYFSPDALHEILLLAASYGLQPHFHADGDGAVRAALDATQILRRSYSSELIRVAIAHDEIVDRKDFSRFAEVGAIPVLSMQWEKPAPDTVDGAKDYLGPARYRYMEPAAFLADAGARIAFGSDWPVDPLNEWFALKVGVTRTNSADAGPKYHGRLSQDRGLTRRQVLQAATINAAYELHEDTQIGSIEVGKLADMIVLDRNVMRIPAEQIADVRVLRTIVGGRTVYQSGDL